MSVIAAIILGIVQGLTEFIPVSSSGHMLLAEKLFNLPSSFKFDVLLNIGTLLALVIYYRTEISNIIQDVLVKRDFKLAAKLVIGTVPVVIVGWLLQTVVETKLQSAWVVVVMLALIGVLMLGSGRKAKGKTIQELPYTGALKVGLTQVVALIPGSSRSGVTILAGEHEGLSAKEAAQFSFMLAIPVIAGATLKVAVSDEGRSFISDHLGLVLLGNLMSFLAGALAIRFLINLLGKYGLKPFGWYRLGLSALLIILLFAKII